MAYISYPSNTVFWIIWFKKRPR